MRILLGALCLVAATACVEKSPAGPTAPLNQQFTLRRGETVSINSASVRLEFVEVTGESRCPANVQCVWAGDAIVHVRALDGAAVADYELHAGDSRRSAASHRQLRIELVQLEPYPVSTRPIGQDDYRATLRVIGS
jgi:hypothetical protein